ncbi:MAG: hypothetical protein ABR534_02130 [Desulfotignum sp.]
MIFSWYEPFDFQERVKRTFSFLNLGILIFSAVIIFSEFRYDWCERLLGTFVASTNDTRPEKGAIWELGQDTISAHESLHKIISRKTDTHQFAQRADSFSHLSARLIPGEWVILDTNQFKRLYRSLPLTHARQIMEPARLIWLLNGDVTDRIFCEGLKNGMKIYFINAENRVVADIDLKENTLAAIAEKQYLEPGRLEKFQGFDGRIYPAEQFFTGVFKLPKEMIPDLLPDTDLILDQDGTILRIGIWNEARDGFIQLGFEFLHQGQPRVLFVRAREWAVWQLGLVLKGEHP